MSDYKRSQALSDLFDCETVADSLGDIELETVTLCTRYQKRKGIRVHREENLRKVLPNVLEPGTVFMVLSSGDIDQLSYPTVLVERLGVFAEFYVSTWTMTHMDVGTIESRQLAGLIQRPTFAVGEYFAKRETAAYATLVQMIARAGGRIRAFPNHAKIVLLGSPERDEWITIAGSSNLSMNPRCEQTFLFNDREIYDFFRAWFEGLFEGTP